MCWRFAALVGLAAAPAWSDGMYDLTKTFTWDVSRKVNDKFVETTGAGTGKVFYFAHAFAEDKHGKIDVDDPNAAPFGAPFPFDLANKVNRPDIRNGRVDYDQHGKYSPAAPFDQGDKIPAEIFGLADTKNGSQQHPQADSLVNFDLKRLGADANGHFHTEASIHLVGHATVAAIPKGHDPETAASQGVSSGGVSLTGTMQKAEIQDGKGPRKEVKTQSLIFAHSTGLDKPNAKNNINGSDPLSLSLFDDATGDLLARQDLWSENFLLANGGGLTWDGTTLSLTADPGGTASISFQTLSSWVLNPFTGRASIDGGAFSTTGDVGALSWTVTSAGGKTTATTTLGELTFDIQPTGIPTPAGDVSAVLEADLRGEANGYRTTTPEPGSFLLVASGTAISIFLARRRRRRG
jgi:hypothetical protein